MAETDRTATEAAKDYAGAVASRDGTKLRTRDLSVFYSSFCALRGVSLDVPSQQITSLIGPSGCGKSTLLRTFNRMNDMIADATRVLVGKELFAGERDRGLWANIPLNNTTDLDAIPANLILGIYNGDGVKGTGDKAIDKLLFNANGPWTAAGFTKAANAKVRQANGEGFDNNNKKDFLVRLTTSPTPSLDIGVSGYFGKNAAEFYNVDLDGDGDTEDDNLTLNLDKKRYGLDLQYVSEFGTSIKLEYVKGKDGPFDTDGGALQVAHRVTPVDLVAVMFDKMGRSGEQDSEYWKVAYLHQIDSGTRLRLAQEVGKKKTDGSDITTLELMKSF